VDNAKIKPLQSKASTLFLGEKEKKTRYEDFRRITSGGRSPQKQHCS